MSYQLDGNLVIYNSSGAAIWATNVFTGDKFHLSKTSFPWTTTFYFKAGDKTVASC